MRTDMDPQTFLNVVGGLVAAGFGWFAKTLYAAVQELRRDLSELHVEIVRDYVPVKRFEDAFAAVSEKLDRIIDKMEHKADR